MTAPILRSPVVVFDTETTGFTKDPDARAWEIAAVLIDRDGTELGSFSAVMRPPVWTRDADAALKIGGVARAEVEAFPPHEEALADLRAWLATIPPDAVYTAFNVDFDRPILARYDIRPPWGPCVMRAVQGIMGKAGALPVFASGDYKFPKLSEAATFYSVPAQEPAHRALADARTAALVLVAAKKRATFTPT